ncbi:MAG: hypothetical protein ACRDM1_13195 [Gaiellaceae bacterium]
MRRLLLTLLCALIAVPAALAGARATGDGILELQAVDATNATIVGRGALWGQLDSGRLIVTDPVAGDGIVYVSGADRTPRPLGDTGTTTLYVGKNIHFRVTGGTYRLTFAKSTGIDLTAVGVGKAYLTGDPLADDPGTYALDGGKWVPVPTVKVPRTVPFGDQSLSSTTSSTQGP